jgi:hypothetical protein
MKEKEPNIIDVHMPHINPVATLDGGENTGPENNSSLPSDRFMLDNKSGGVQKLNTRSFK